MNSMAPSPIGLAAVREGVAALRARAWILALLTLVGIILGFVLSGSDGGAVYQAKIIAQPLQSNGSVVAIGISTPEGPQPAEFLDERTLEIMESVTGLRRDDLDLGLLTIQQPPAEALRPPIILSVHGSSYAEAKFLLKTWMRSIHEARAAYIKRILDRGEKGLHKDLAKAIRRGEGALRTQLVALLARLQALRATLNVDYVIVQEPQVSKAEETSRAKSVAIGAIGGLLVGVGLVLLIALSDGRIRTREGLEAALELEVLADLRPRAPAPSLEHARARLQTIGDGKVPTPVVLLPCGKAETGDAVAKLSAALGEGVEVRPSAGPLGQPGTLESLSGAGAWVVVAAPGGTTRREVAGLRAEVFPVDGGPAGLVVV